MTTLEEESIGFGSSCTSREGGLAHIGRVLRRTGSKNNHRGQRTFQRRIKANKGIEDSLEVHPSLINHPPHNLLQLIAGRVPRTLSSKQRSIPTGAFDPGRVEERPPSICPRRLGRDIVRGCWRRRGGGQSCQSLFQCKSCRSHFPRERRGRRTGGGEFSHGNVAEATFRFAGARPKLAADRTSGCRQTLLEWAGLLCGETRRDMVTSRKVTTDGPEASQKVKTAERTTFHKTAKIASARQTDC